MKKILILFAVCFALVPGAGAQTWTEVNNYKGLTTAVKTNGAHIRLTEDIRLSSSLAIIDKTVTIDLNGHTLDRNLKTTAESNGHVMQLLNHAYVTLSNGKLQRGIADNGGGIWVGSDCSLTLNDVVIEECEALETGADGNKDDDGRGGAICNHGTLVINGGTISRCSSVDGGAIYNSSSGTLTVNSGTFTRNRTTKYGGGAVTNQGTMSVNGGLFTDNNSSGNGGGIYSNGTLNMQGSPKIYNNRKSSVSNNLYLAEKRVITVTGPFTEGCDIGICMAGFDGLFTSGLIDIQNPAIAVKYFSSDNDELRTIYSDGECGLAFKAKGTVYVDRVWDGSHVVSQAKICPEAIALKSSSNATVLSEDWYVLNTNVTYDQPLFINGDVHLILKDGCTLTAKEGILINFDKTLSVYGQAGDSGKIYSHPTRNVAGIGGSENYIAGRFIVHGGSIDAKGGSNNYAGIGGGDHKSGIQLVEIYGGNVIAVGRNSAAGIGKGQQNEYDEEITIYGGTVYARGGVSSNGTADRAGAGIGGGEDCGSGWIRIFGGDVTAIGANHAAGIGGGEKGGMNMPIEIYGGTVRATALGDEGAGIGTGKNRRPYNIEIHGGDVTAKGASGGAGIGGGDGAGGFDVAIYGGRVYAEGGGISNGHQYGGPGIGPGGGAVGGYVYVGNATVIAKAGAHAKAAFVVGGIDEDDDGELDGDMSLADEVAVYCGGSENSAKVQIAEKREEACTHADYVRIEPCKHSLDSEGNCSLCLSGSWDVNLSDFSNNNGLIDKYWGKKVDLTLMGRTIFKDGSWNTLCLPFDIDNLSDLDGTPLDGATIMTLNQVRIAYGYARVEFSGSVNSIPAGSPFIAKWDSGEDIKDPVFRQVTIQGTPRSNYFEGGRFEGIFGPVSLKGGDKSRFYLGAENKFYHPALDLNLNSFRAYFILNDGVTIREMVSNLND